MTELTTNENIKNKEMLIIDENGNKLGIMKRDDALRMAYDAGLDLALVGGNNNLATCKIMDYGKYKYDTLKKEKEAKKNQKIIETAEIQIGINIQQHDMITKANSIKRLISKGNDVRIVLRLNGREINRITDAKAKVDSLISMCTEFAKVKKEIDVDGRDVRAILEKA